MVGTGRFELPACRLGGGRSIHLSYVPANSRLFSAYPLAPAFPPAVALAGPCLPGQAGQAMPAFAGRRALLGWFRLGGIHRIQP